MKCSCPPGRSRRLHRGEKLDRYEEKCPGLWCVDPSFDALERSSNLATVFLRVLEYYDGILVLTSNRVGTFDEAFKSRIQLALRYPNLDQEQRQEIWRNFFQMLRRTKERVDMDDLEMNIDALAAVDINGRQIRNIVTMARHLAKFRKERLVYRHVQLAIQTVTKFEEYLTEVKGVSDDNWAREDKLR